MARAFLARAGSRILKSSLEYLRPEDQALSGTSSPGRISLSAFPYFAAIILIMLIFAVKYFVVQSSNQRIIDEQFQNMSNISQFATYDFSALSSSIDDRAIDHTFELIMNSRLPGELKQKFSVILWGENGDLKSVTGLQLSTNDRNSLRQFISELVLSANSKSALNHKELGLVYANLLPSPLGGVVVILPPDQLSKVMVQNIQQIEQISMVAVIFLAILGLVMGITLGALHKRRTKMLNMIRRQDEALLEGRCGIWDWDIGRGSIRFSSSATRLLGFKADTEMISTGQLQQMFRSDGIDLYRMGKELVQGKTNEFETSALIEDKTGSVKLIHFKGKLKQGNDDHSPHLIGSMTDITRMQQLVKERKQAHYRLHEAVESISQGFLLWDNDDRLLMCNQSFRDLCDSDKVQVKPGMHYEEIIKGANNPELVEAVHSPTLMGHLSEKGEENSAPRSAEVRLSNGTWLRINAKRLDSGDKVITFTDLTQIKNQEQKLIEQDRQLRLNIQDLSRTRLEIENKAKQLEALNRQVLQEKLNAENASNVKSEFLANISHEFRTPLNAIIGFAQFIDRNLSHNRRMTDQQTQQTAEYIKDIKSSGEYLLEVVDDILEISTIEAGQFRIQPSQVDLSAILKDVEHALSGEAISRKVKLSLNYPEYFPMIADGDALRQVMYNILSNAVKFNNRHGYVSLRIKEQPNCVLVTVEDNGPGIPKTELHKVTEPFAQVEPHITKSKPGTGLGLSVAKALTLMHGGRIRLWSKEGKGTTVIIRLPYDASHSRHRTVNDKFTSHAA